MHVEGDLPPALQFLLLHAAVVAGYQALGGEGVDRNAVSM